MKLVNYRCEECGLELEWLDDGDPPVEECPRCGEKMSPFNFKNNSQRARVND